MGNIFLLLAGGSGAEENGHDVGVFDFTIVNIGITATWNIGSALFLLVFHLYII